MFQIINCVFQRGLNFVNLKVQAYYYRQLSIQYRFQLKLQLQKTVLVASCFYKSQQKYVLNQIISDLRKIILGKWGLLNHVLICTL